MFVVNSGCIGIGCCVSDLGEGAARAASGFERAGVGEAGCWVCTESTVERI